MSEVGLPPARTGEDMGEATLGILKRELPFSSRHRDIQLAQEHVNLYTKHDGDACYQPMYRVATSHSMQMAEGSKEVRDAALCNLVVWPCLVNAKDHDFPNKWSLNFKVRIMICVCLKECFG